METIKKLWFSKNRIYIETSTNKIYSRPLEAFPRLLDATEEQREAYKVGAFGDDVRWEMIDEDIHISSFMITQEPNPNNSIAEVFEKFPQLNLSQVAQSIGINKSLMAKYIYGIKPPSEKRKKEIEEGLHKLAKELLEIKIA